MVAQMISLLVNVSQPVCSTFSFFCCRLIKETVERWGTVDVLVNNAGITRDTLIMRMKPDQWQSVIDTNLSAVFYASQVCLAEPDLAQMS